MSNPTKQELAEWRYRCEKCIERWNAMKASLEWWLSVPDTLRLLNYIRDLEASVRQLKGRIEARLPPGESITCTPPAEPAPEGH